VILFGVDASPPADWERVFELPALQMVVENVVAAPASNAVELGPTDVPEMRELVEITEPGPFAARAAELGRFVGIREKGQLVAMSGERFRCDGFTEVSAVCTHPDHRGRGLGAAVVANTVASIAARGDTACLHVAQWNTPAIRLYESLGFTTRRPVTGRVFTTP
jgi:predicted GNAT family acetyltransferase